MKSGIRKNFFNEHFFDNLESEKACYWLGFIYADGCVFDGSSCETQTSYRLSINLKRSDKRHLEKFAEDLEYTGKIRDIVSISYLTKNPSEQCKIVLNSNALCRSLIDNGAVQNKTRLMEIPKNLKEEDFYIFLRGYIDGDGCYYYKKRKEWDGYRFNVEIVSYCINILEFIKNRCLKDGIKSSIHKNKNSESYVLYFTGKKNVGKLIELTYKNSTIFLDRKYIKAQQLLQIATLGRNAYRLEGGIGEIFQISIDNAEITDESKNSSTS